MWLADYSRKTIIRELHHIGHEVLDDWTRQFQTTMCDWYDLVAPAEVKKMFDKDTAFAVKKKPAGNGVVAKKPARASLVKKKPTSKYVKLRPASAKFAKQVKKTIKKRVLIADESFLNKSKPGKLTKAARPKKDQIWIWGAVLQGKAKTHFVFRILAHPLDAFDGKPRGHQEMMTNLEMLGFQKGDIFVSDGWKATRSAVKATRKKLKLTERDLKHQVVVHSDGEIINADGFTTNAIESKWGVLKRWMRAKYGGKLPGHLDRDKWRRAIGEYQARALLSSDEHTVDKGNYYYLPFADAIQVYAIS
jgi:hypothetical protein